MLLACGFLGAYALAQTPDAKKPGDKPVAKKDGAPGDAEMEKMMAAWAKAATPSEGHANLKPLAGKWTYVTKWRMTPEAPFEESTGKAEYKWVMGGRFLTLDVKNNPQPDDAKMGGPFEGFGIYGYDNLTKKYVSVWYDNMGTGIMTSEGTADGSGKTFTFASPEGYICPMTGEKKHPKTVLKIVGDDKVVFEMYDKAPDGKEFIGLEVTYTRAK